MDLMRLKMYCKFSRMQLDSTVIYVLREHEHRKNLSYSKHQSLLQREKLFSKTLLLATSCIIQQHCLFKLFF